MHEHYVDRLHIPETTGSVQKVRQSTSSPRNQGFLSPPRHAPSNTLAPATPSAP